MLDPEPLTDAALAAALARKIDCICEKKGETEVRGLSLSREVNVESVRCKKCARTWHRQWN